MNFNNNLYDFMDGPCSQKQAVINLRSYARNIPSAPLQPYLEARAVSTKYSMLPIVDERKQSTVPLIQQPTFNNDFIYNPSGHAPWSGYSSNIQNESILKNLYEKNTKYGNALEHTYIPSSNSSLYNINWINQQKPIQPFPKLFESYVQPQQIPSQIQLQQSQHTQHNQQTQQKSSQSQQITNNTTTTFYNPELIGYALFNNNSRPSKTK